MSWFSNFVNGIKEEEVLGGYLKLDSSGGSTSKESRKPRSCGPSEADAVRLLRRAGFLEVLEKELWTKLDDEVVCGSLWLADLAVCGLADCERRAREVGKKLRQMLSALFELKGRAGGSLGEAVAGGGWLHLVLHMGTLEAEYTAGGLGSVGVKHFPNGDLILAINPWGSSWEVCEKLIKEAAIELGEGYGLKKPSSNRGLSGLEVAFSGASVSAAFTIFEEAIAKLMRCEEAASRERVKP